MHKTIQNLTQFQILGILLATFFLLVVPKHVGAIAAPPVTAVDVIGQPNFTNVYGTPPETGLSNPGGLSMDTVNHRLFVADGAYNRVLVYNLNTNDQLIDKTPDFVIGQPNFTSTSSGRTATTLNMETGGVKYDSVNNRLFVSDGGNNRVLVFNTTTITNGMSASNVLGQADFTSGSILTTSIKTVEPDGSLAFDPVRQLLFAPDYRGNRVMVFDVNSITNNEDAVNVIGQTNFTNTGADTTASMGYIGYTGIEYDTTTKRLYLSDRDNHRVLIFDTTTITNGLSASYVLGQTDFTSSGYDTTRSSMEYPGGLAIDVASQVLYLIDSGNYRVLLFDVNTIVNGEDAIGVFGQPDFTTGSSLAASATAFDSYVGNGMVFEPKSGQLYMPDHGNRRVLVWPNVYDTDNVSSDVENAAPNNGDANNDGIKDSLQANVTSLINAVTGKYTVLESSTCTDNSTVSTSAESIDPAIADGTYDYPSGLLDFTITGCATGVTETIKVYSYGVSGNVDDFVLRKFDGSNYTTISGATFILSTIGGEQAVVATYQVTDGGANDQDGVANSTIVDPVGFAVLPASTEAPATPDSSSEGLLADTGVSSMLAIATGVMLITVSITVTKMRQHVD